jgi:acetyl-CoA synthetase
MTPDERVAELLMTFDTAGLTLAELLCDRHPADAVAFTIVQADLSSVDPPTASCASVPPGWQPASPRWGWRPGTGWRP